MKHSKIQVGNRASFQAPTEVFGSSEEGWRASLLEGESRKLTYYILLYQAKQCR